MPGADALEEFSPGKLFSQPVELAYILSKPLLVVVVAEGQFIIANRLANQPKQALIGGFSVVNRAP
jgi:hypothetical protein